MWIGEKDEKRPLPNCTLCFVHFAFFPHLAAAAFAGDLAAVALSLALEISLRRPALFPLRGVGPPGEHPKFTRAS
jgi:hypothetical protein